MNFNPWGYKIILDPKDAPKIDTQAILKKDDIALADDKMTKELAKLSEAILESKNKGTTKH